MVCPNLAALRNILLSPSSDLALGVECVINDFDYGVFIGVPILNWILKRGQCSMLENGIFENLNNDSRKCKNFMT